MADSAAPPLAESTTAKSEGLYDRDFFAWTQEQARLLRRVKPAGVDWENAAEEIEGVGRSIKTEIRTRMTELLAHLLCWQFQPERRGHRWQSAIGEQRIFIKGLLADSPSLSGYPARVAATCYARARRRAAVETGLALSIFPEALPYAVSELQNYRFMPGKPWAPDELGD